MIRLLTLLVLLAAPVWAIEPDEVLNNPVLEKRARVLSVGLRCPVCRNENIDLSNAALAKELRIVLRERLVAGDSDAQAVNYMVSRYGEFILLRPDVTGANWVLWGAAPVMFILALGVGWGVIRKRPVLAQSSLSDEEQVRLDRILGD